MPDLSQLSFGAPPGEHFREDKMVQSPAQRQPEENATKQMNQKRLT